MRILLIEDEKRLSNVIRKGLEEDGFAVDTAFDGEEGQYLAESESYDLIILDVMLPKIDGITVVKSIRKKGHKTPILILSAKSNLEDKIVGLDSGSDDYMTKPFSFLELRSRVRVHIRRTSRDANATLTIADLTVDPLKHIVGRGGKNIVLTPKEFAILEFLLHHKDEVVTRTMITDHVWDYNFDGMSNVVDVFLANLRKKIDKNTAKKLIHTVFGVGYKISENV